MRMSKEDRQKFLNTAARDGITLDEARQHLADCQEAISETERMRQRVAALEQEAQQWKAGLAVQSRFWQRMAAALTDG
jgi:hypothetical protein